MFIEISDTLKKLSKFFPENLFVVGGYVRSKLMGLEGSDVDISSSVDIEQVSKRLEGSGYAVKIKNLKLGSLLISKNGENFEYTAFRKEVYSGGEHYPTQVERAEKIEEDSLRRDFSVNAIYYNINKDEIVDLHHGVVDLAEKKLRCVVDPDEVLKFDGERILRMVRIAGELDFKIDKKTLQAAKKYAKNLEDVSGTRKYAELEKILYCDKRYGLNKKSVKNALKILNDISVWQHFGLRCQKIKYKMVTRAEDRVLGLLIDIVDSEKPACLEAFLGKFLKEQFAFSAALSKKNIFLSCGIL